MTTLPAAKATSVTGSSFWEGSITRPPRRTKLKGLVISECESEGNAGSTSVAQDHALPRLGACRSHKPGAHAANTPNLSKFRATKPSIEDAYVR
jgi:hypothetical protein